MGIDLAAHEPGGQSDGFHATLVAIDVRVFVAVEEQIGVLDHRGSHVSVQIERGDEW